MDQRQAFLAGEGDAWHRRNSPPDPSAAVRTHQLDVVQKFVRPGTRLLEIGCSTGLNSHLLSRRLGAGEFFGLDPSREAIETGRVDYPDLMLSMGTADDLPYKNEFFDFVWFASCLYLVDRPLLHRVVAEADRVLAHGGVLAITDFDPPLPAKRQYRHLDGVVSYKMDYSRLFLADPAYVLAEKSPISMDGANYEINGANRAALWILRKETEANYAFEPD